MLVPVAPAEEPRAAAPESDDAGLDELDAMFGELADGSGPFTVTIYRRQMTGPDAGKMAFVTTVPADGFTLADLQRDHGGGRYHLKVRDGSTGRIRRLRDVVIEGAPAATPAPTAAQPQESEMMSVLRSINERLSTVGAPPPSQSMDMFAMFKEFAEVMRTLAPTPAQAGGNTAKELMDMYWRGRDEARQEGSGSTGFREIISDFGAPLIAVARENLEMQRRAIPPMAPQSAPIPAPMPAPTPTSGVPDVAPPWVFVIRPYIEPLYNRAVAGKNARVYANTLVEDLPEGMVGMVSQLLESGDFVDQFIAAYPQFGETEQLRSWVGEFVEEARDLLAVAEDADEWESDSEVSHG